MSESATIARPYAKAIFEYALSQNQLPFWSQCLALFSQCLSSKDMIDFIKNPSSTPEKQTKLLLAVFSALTKTEASAEVQRGVQVLATNRRLLLFPKIREQYEIMKAEQEKTTEALVISSTELSASQREKIVQALSKRLQRKVSLQEVVDASLIGGAMIRAGDLVIDGTVRGKLNTLSAALIA